MKNTNVQKISGGECSKKETPIIYDENNKYFIFANKERNDIRVYDLSTEEEYQIKYYYRVDFFSSQPIIIIDTKSNQIVVYSHRELDIINYITNEQTKSKFDGEDNLVIDFDKGYLLFYQLSHIHVYKFPQLQFIKQTMDTQNPDADVTDIFLDLFMNTLILYKNNSSVILYDLHQILNTELNYFSQFIEVQALCFQQNLYLVYNIQNRALVLFYFSTVKDIVFVEFSKSNIPKFGKLFKIQEELFIYVNTDFMFFGGINFANQKIIERFSEYLSISVKDLFLNEKNQKENYELLLIETNNDIYELDLLFSFKFKYVFLNRTIKNNNQYKFFKGFIQLQKLVFYSGNNIYIYTAGSDKIKNQSISLKDISLVLKLPSSTSSAANLLDHNNNYLLDYYNTNKFDLIDSNILVIINNDKRIMILDCIQLSELYSVQVSFVIMNIYVEKQGLLIYIIGNRGKTHIYNYQLEQIAYINNPCLQQTKILSDNFYIYAFCKKQLEIYYRETFKKAFPSYTMDNLHNIIHTQDKNIFIVILNKKIQVLTLSPTSQTPKIMFEKDQKLLQILSQQIIVDTNSNRYLEIIALSTIDIAYYKISLIQEKICQYIYQQRNTENLNIYSYKNILTNFDDSKQKLKVLRIEYKSNQYLQAPLISKEMVPEGEKIIVLLTQKEDSKNKPIVKWNDQKIFNNNLIEDLQITSLNLIIQADDNFILNQKQNMNKLFLKEINIIEINNTLIIKNYKKVIIQNINLSQSEPKIQGNIISFENCNEIFIEILIIQNSKFDARCILQFLNSDKITIKNITVTDSNFQSLINFFQIKQITLQSLEFLNIDVQKSLFNYTQISQTNFVNASFNNIKGGGVLIKQQRCSYIQIKDTQIIKSKSLIVLETIDQRNNFAFDNQLIHIQNLTLTDSENIYFNIFSNETLIQDSHINNITLLQKNLFSLKSMSIILQNNSFTNLQSGFDVFILSIKDFNRVNITNSKFEKNSIQLLKFMSLEENNTIYFKSVNITKNERNKPLTLLIQIQYITFFEIQQSYFISNIVLNDGGVLQIQDMKLLQVSNSFFATNLSLEGKGGAVYLYNVIETNIKTTQFINNTSVNDYGGALYCKSSQNINPCAILSINENAIFQYNQALSGKGGAIFLDNVNLIMESVTIIKNSAAVGGGISYEKVIPDILVNRQLLQKNQIYNNDAIFFGQNIGSTLRKIQYVPDKHQNNSYFFLPENIQNILEVQNFQSGGYFELLNMNLLDEEQNELHFNRINVKKLNKELQQEIESIYLRIVSQDHNQDIIFEGNLVQTYSDKGFNFNISLNHKPLSTGSFQIQSNQINELKYLNGSSLESQLTLQFEVRFRDCIEGEIRVPVLRNEICQRCSDGKYSLNKNDVRCQVCPIQANNCSGSIISLKNGYWRKDLYSDTIVPCKIKSASCKPEDSFSKHGCSEGYIGPLCEQCDYQGEVWDERYSQTFLSSQKCYKCKKDATFFILSIMIFFIFLFIQIEYAISQIQDQIEKYLTAYYIKLGGFLYLSKTGNVISQDLQQNRMVYQNIKSNMDMDGILNLNKIKQIGFYSFINFF